MQAKRVLNGSLVVNIKHTPGLPYLQMTNLTFTIESEHMGAMDFSDSIQRFRAQAWEQSYTHQAFPLKFRSSRRRRSRDSCYSQERGSN